MLLKINSWIQNLKIKSVMDSKIDNISHKKSYLNFMKFSIFASFSWKRKNIPSSKTKIEFIFFVQRACQPKPVHNRLKPILKEHFYFRLKHKYNSYSISRESKEGAPVGGLNGLKNDSTKNLFIHLFLT